MKKLILSLVSGLVGIGAAFGAAPVLTVGFEDAVNCDFDAALSWTADDGAVTIERKIGDAGAWKTKATLEAGTTSWVDPSPVLGKTYFYRVTVGEESSEELRFNRVRKLEVSSDKVFTDATKKWGEHRTAASVFDGRIDNFETHFADLYDGICGNKPKVGVDFGDTTTTVALVRAYPRQQGNATAWGESNGARIYGSDLTGADESATTDLANEIAGPTRFTGLEWIALPIAEPKAYRSVYYYGVSYGNMTEMEFYGWTEADVAAAAETTLTLSVTRSDYTDSFAVLTWDADAAEGEVTVQRRKASGVWSDLGTSDSGTYRDETMGYGYTWEYRLKVDEQTSAPVSFVRMHRLATTDATKFYQGDAPWDPNATGEKAFDGNLGSFPDLNYNKPKVGVDFGEGASLYVALVRLSPREGYYSSRLNGLVIYGSDNDAETEKGNDNLGTALTTAISGVPGDLGQGKWYEVEADATNPYRTLYAKGNDNGNAAEIEFYGWLEEEVESDGPEVIASIDNFRVTGGGTYGYTAQLLWTPVRAAVAVERAMSPTGPWTKIADVAAKVGTFTDDEAPIGREAYYRVTCGEVESNVVHYKSLRKLSVEGAVLFSQGNPWEPGRDHAAVFDGNTSTFADLWGGDNNPYGKPKVGVDFGEATKTVAVVKFYPRHDCLYRMAGVKLYGSNEGAETERANPSTGTAITPAVSDVPSAQWYTVAVNDPQPYRTYYACDCYEGGQIAEIEFYGWTEEDLAVPGVVVPVMGAVTADPDAATITVAWTCEGAENLTGFTLERQQEGSEWTTLATLEATAFSYVDEDPETRQTYAYRVTATYADGSVKTSDPTEGVYYVKTVPPVALTIPAIENATVKSVKADGKEIEGEDGVYLIPQGSPVVVTFVPAAGYVLDRNTMSFTVNEEMTLPEVGRPVAQEGVPLQVTEVMASNKATLVTSDGTEEMDWVEVYNSGATDIDLAGWFMSDNPAKASKWVPIEGPAVVPAGGYLVIFADTAKKDWHEADCHVALGFSSGGEAVALGTPEKTIVSSFEFGQQFDDVSFGLGHVESALVKSTRAAEYRIGEGEWKACAGAIGMASVTGAFKIDTYFAKNCSCNSLTIAKQIVNDPESWSWYHASETKQTLAYFHAYTGTHTTFAPYNDFPAPEGWDGNNMAVHVTGVINIPEAGDWTFSMYGDDQFEYTISGNGVKFTATGGGWDSQSCDSFFFSKPGDYEVEIFLSQQGGDVGFDFSVAKGDFDRFSRDNFNLVGSTASGVLHSGSIASKIYTRIDGEMLGKSETASWRKAFTLDRIPEAGEIQLRIAYADGFTAKLNGEVFETVAATGARTDEAILKPAYFDIPVGLLVEGENLLEVTGVNNAIDDPTFLIAPDVILNTESGLVYFTTPTPGRANATDGKTGMTPEIVFSEPHGYKTEAFELTLSCPADDGARIYYTLNGSSPTTDSFLYTGPIAISKTTVVRAAAANEDSVYQRDSSATYLFLEDVLSAPQGYNTENVPAGWPSNGSLRPDGSQYGASMFYGMNQKFVAEDRERIERGFTNSVNVATISIVTDLANLFDNSMGIWCNAGAHGRDWERPIMVEQIDPVTGAANEFSVSAGLRMRGGMSRGLGNEKHGFRLFFRAEYGMSKLDFPLFGAEGSDSFKKVDLRCSQNHSIANGKGDNPVSGMYDTLVHEVFSRDTQLAMGEEGTRSRYYNLFINGVYYGIYQTQERGDDSFAETYLGDQKENYDVIRTSSTYSYADNSAHYTTEANEGTIDAWSNLWQIAVVEGVAGNEANYQRLLGNNPDGSRNPAYPILLNVANLQDFVINAQYAADCDSPASVFGGAANNVVAIRNRIDGAAAKDGFIFLRHDSEYSLGIHDFGAFNEGWDDYWCSNASRYGTEDWSNNFRELGNFNPAELHWKLMANPDYKMEFVDRVYRHCLKEGGALTVPEARARFEKRMAEIDDAVSCEIARWAHRGQTHATWENATARCLTFIDNRVPELIKDYKSRGWYPSVEAAVVTTNADFTATFAGVGTVYYTTDGSDPRLAGGGLNPNAIAANEPFTVPEGGATVQLRVLAANGEWSPLESADLIGPEPEVVADKLADVVRFHSFCGVPADGLGGDSGEWVTLTNLSETTSFDLQGLKFVFCKTGDALAKAKCIVTVGESLTLEAGASVTFNQDDYWYSADGKKKITNGAIDLHLYDTDGTTEIQTSHLDQNNFPTAKDETIGSALVATSFASELAESDWKAVVSPVMGYLRYHSFAGITADGKGDANEWVVLTNLSATVDLDLTGANMTIVKKDDAIADAKCVVTFAEETVLPAGGSLRLEQATSGWTKITNGDIEMHLFDADGQTAQFSSVSQKAFADYAAAKTWLVATAFGANLTTTDWQEYVEPTADAPTTADGTVVGTIVEGVAVIDAAQAGAGDVITIPAGVTEVQLKVEVEGVAIDTTGYYTAASLTVADGTVTPELDAEVVTPSFAESAEGANDALVVGETTVALTATAKPGLFYTLLKSSEVNGTYESVTKVQAKSGETTVSFAAEKGLEPSAFYKIVVSDR